VVGLERRERPLQAGLMRFPCVPRGCMSIASGRACIHTEAERERGASNRMERESGRYEDHLPPETGIAWGRDNTHSCSTQVASCKPRFLLVFLGVYVCI
jgi:hypothetical protein